MKTIINGCDNLHQKICKYYKNKLQSDVRLDVGFLNKSTAKIAIIQEFGASIPITPKMRHWFKKRGVYLRKDKTHIIIPPRPFMQMTVNEHSKDWVNVLKTYFKQNHDITTSFEILGRYIRDNIVQMIETGNHIPNSELTILWKKGKSQPLVNTGEMRNSVEFKVTS